MDTSTGTRARLSVRITGRVQGVGFRYFTKRQARQLDLSGWVRNESDGSVRIEAEGNREALEELLVAVKDGPTAAQIDNVSADWEEASGEFDRFGVRR